MANDSTAFIQHWLDRHAAGDPAAREELIRHGQERLRRLTRRMLRDYSRLRRWEDTSDVLQNVLIDLDRALHTTTLATPRDLLCFSAALVRRELINLSRHHFGPHGDGRHYVSPVAGENGLCPEPADGADDASRLDFWCEFHQYIDDLSHEDRVLFDLLYYQGLTQPMAATLLMKPLRSLKRDWHRVKQNLMKRFGDDLPF